jgi:hypothetical protein
MRLRITLEAPVCEVFRDGEPGLAEWLAKTAHGGTRMRIFREMAAIGAVVGLTADLTPAEVDARVAGDRECSDRISFPPVARGPSTSMENCPLPRGRLLRGD